MQLITSSLILWLFLKIRSTFKNGKICHHQIFLWEHGFLPILFSDIFPGLEWCLLIIGLDEYLPNEWMVRRLWNELECRTEKRAVEWEGKSKTRIAGNALQESARCTCRTRPDPRVACVPACSPISIMLLFLKAQHLLLFLENYSRAAGADLPVNEEQGQFQGILSPKKPCILDDGCPHLNSQSPVDLTEPVTLLKIRPFLGSETWPKTTII